MVGAALLWRLLLIASASTTASLAPLAARDGSDGGTATPPPPAIVQIIADDLGYNDLGFTNGEKTRERRARFFLSDPQRRSSAPRTAILGCTAELLLCGMPGAYCGWQTRRTSTWR